MWPRPQSRTPGSRPHLEPGAGLPTLDPRPLTLDLGAWMLTKIFTPDLDPGPWTLTLTPDLDFRPQILTLNPRLQAQTPDPGP